MATTTLGADSARNNLTVKLPTSIALRSGAVEAPPELVGEIIEQLIGALDAGAGDPDMELNGDDELAGDEADLSYPEWHTRGRHKTTAAGAEGVVHSLAGWSLDEGDEDDDPDTGCEDGPAHDDGRPGDLEDAEEQWDRELDQSDDEREQMPDDVPAPRVFALEPNIFTGEREFLGINAAGAFVGKAHRL